MIPASLVAATFLLSTRAPRRAGDKEVPFESGVSSHTFTPGRFTISYYLTAMLFIVFDIEVVFLYPVGVLVHATKSVFVLAEILVFVVLLLVALVFVWRRGALDWK